MAKVAGEEGRGTEQTEQKGDLRKIQKGGEESAQPSGKSLQVADVPSLGTSCAPAARGKVSLLNHGRQS